MPRVLPVAASAGGTLVAMTLVLPAAAHPGAHEGLDWGELAQHLATAWHVWPLVAAAAAGLAVLLIRQRQQASAKSAARNREARP